MSVINYKSEELNKNTKKTKLKYISQILVLLIIWQMTAWASFLDDNNFYNQNSATKSIKTFSSKAPLFNSQTQTLTTRHSPKLNSNAKIEGSIRILSAENFDINSNAIVTGDIYIPGSPKIKASSKLNYKETRGNGNQEPSNHIIKINGDASINHIITCTDTININSVVSVAQSKGTKDVFLVKGDKISDFSEIRDLVLTKRYNLKLEVPEGTYGNFRTHRKSVFILGVDKQETTYNLQSLELNSNSSLQIRGKVTINIKNNLILNSNAKMGNVTKPSNLLVNVESGEIKLNSDAELYGLLNLPLGKLTLNSNSKLIGLVVCNEAILNSHSLLRHSD